MNETILKIIWGCVVLAWAQAYIASRVKVNADGCWVWQCGGDGRYGHAYAFGARIKAHVLSFLAHGGALRRHEIVGHTRCDVTACCNPAHLAAQTQVENMKEAHAKYRAYRRPRKNAWAGDCHDGR